MRMITIFRENLNLERKKKLYDKPKFKFIIAFFLNFGFVFLKIQVYLGYSGVSVNDYHPQQQKNPNEELHCQRVSDYHESTRNCDRERSVGAASADTLMLSCM